MSFIPQWYSRRLSTKLIVAILLLLLLSITLISSLYYQSSSSMLSNHVRASAKQSAKQSADYLSLILTVGRDSAQQIFRDSQIQEVLQEEKQGPDSIDRKFDHKEKVGNLLNNLIDTSSFVQSVYLLREQGSSWGSGLFNVSKVTRYTLSEHDWYQDIVSGREDEWWQALHYDPFSGGGENNELVLTYVKALRDLETGQALGAIMVNMDGNLLLEAIGRNRLGETGRFFVVDPQGNVMIGSEPGEWGLPIESAEFRQALLSSSSSENELEMEVGGVKTYAVARKMENGWTVVGAVPVREAIGDIQQLQKKIWLYAAILMAGASLTGFLFSRRITSPLKRLMKQMSELERSNFEALTEVRSQDEIGQLSRRFNQMVGQIKMLIEQVNEVEAKKREAEIRALRHQINPHFLYNTLATIRWMIKLGRQDGAYQGISALVRLMEASMGKTGVYCTIGEELDLLEKFMLIQQYRYGDHIKLVVDCEPGLAEVPIPRMLLQPIVENAVFHGLAPKPEGGRIDIVIRRGERLSPSAPEVLTIKIQDDGIGLDPGRAQRLGGRSGASSSGMLGLGLNHVRETIELYFGAASGMRIESAEGRGTSVTMTLVRKAGDVHDLQSADC
ncbi:cache domain-containing sensor histidine kinase [Cohnella fermenti]|nr:sensor histidine kinase [Cohnella fermenti]